MMRTLVKEAGLEPVVLSEGEMSEQERLIELQQTGALKTGIRDAAAGFDSVDFRLTGSVTSYSEIAESFDVLLGQSKTIIARVQVDYALVDIATGRSLVADSGTGVYKKKSTKFLGIGSGSTSDPALRDGALRDALTRSLKNMVDALNARPFVGRGSLCRRRRHTHKGRDKEPPRRRHDCLASTGWATTLSTPTPAGSSANARRRSESWLSRATRTTRSPIPAPESGGGFQKGDVVKER